MNDTRFQTFTAPAGENAPEGTPDSTIRARISRGKVKGDNGDDGPDVVRTIEGERTVNEGDVVIERADSPGTFDVVDKDAWSGLGWKAESTYRSSSPAKTASKSTRKR